MSDITLSRLHTEIVAGAVEAAQPTIPVPTLPDATTAWVAKSVIFTGGIVATYTAIANVKLVWLLDAEMVATFDIPFGTPDIDLLPTTGKTGPPLEVQLFRNGHCIFWGPITARRGDTTERVWHYTAKDPLYYLRSRNMGQAKRKNYLTNGDFETNAVPWEAVGSFTPSIDGSRFVTGSASLRVAATDSGENFYRQRFTISSGPEGLALFLTAWVYVDIFTAGAFGNRGALIARLGATGAGAQGIATIDATTPARGSFQRLSCHCVMPPNTTETIETRIHAWDGEGNWDAVTVTVEESLSFIDINSPGGAGWDQIQIAMMTSRYLSGAFPIGGTYTKSDLQLPVSGVLSGIKKERNYQFVDHQPGYEGGVGNGALDEWCRSNEGFDFRIDIDSITKRTHRFYYPAVGQTWDTGMVTGDAGTSHTAFQLHRVLTGESLTGANWGIVKLSYADTLDGAGTDICELGNSPIDSGREEGAFSDDGALGGLTMEIVEAAPSDAPIDLLDSIAAQTGARVAKVIETPVFTMVEPRDPITQVVLVALIGVLLPGDIIPLDVLDETNGSVDVVYDDLFRVIQVTLNPDETLDVMVDI